MYCRLVKKAVKKFNKKNNQKDHQKDPIKMAKFKLTCPKSYMAFWSS